MARGVAVLVQGGLEDPSSRSAATAALRGRLFFHSRTSTEIRQPVHLRLKRNLCSEITDFVVGCSI